jgi:signal transduction histidine kinase/ActR/RegA family two-component response regulator
MLKKITLLLIGNLFIYCTISCSKSDTLTPQEKEYLQKNDNLKVAVYPSYPPYQFVNDQGKIDGIFIDFLSLIEKKVNHKFKKVYYADWSKLFDDAKKNKFDLILEIQQSKSREAFLTFSPPLFESEHILVQRKGDKVVHDLNDFGNRSLILPYKFYITEAIKKKYPNIKIAYALDDLECLAKLNSGKYDGYVGPKAMFNYLRNKRKLNQLSIAYELDISYKPGLAIVKKNKILSSIILKTYDGITTKEKNAIFDNWLFKVVTPFYEKLSFWIFLSLLIVFLMLSILSVNSFLKYKIKISTANLRIAKEKAEESDRLKTNFIQNISHEIRTPMNGIIGFSELLEKGGLTIQEQKEYAKIIVRNSKELIVIIDNILEISKLQTEKIVIRPEEIELDTVLQNIYNNYKSKALEKNIALILENKISPNHNQILIDKPRLIKILNNLIDNAIKFTPNGTVLIDCKVLNQSLLFSIKDSGIGIKKKDQKRIFHNFSQSEKEISKNYGGLGLGLSIAKKNANLIGGDISFTTEVNQGSTFKLVVPFVPVINSKEINAKSDSKENEKLVKQIVLIAEDGDINFLFLKTILSKIPDYNFIIHRAENGKEAVEICKENKEINLVLMDIKMPIMDGYEATERIKKLRPKLPVIAQTAFSTEEDIQKAINAGCDDFISKPIDRILLQAILSRYIL